jgi:hypothetical protein
MLAGGIHVEYTFNVRRAAALFSAAEHVEPTAIQAQMTRYR